MKSKRGAMALLVGLIVAACGSPPPTPTPTPSATPAATPTSSPAPTSASSATGGAWTGLRWEAPALTAPYVSISDVVAWRGGYVAVGQSQNPKGGTQAAAWSSTDWRTWSRTLLDVSEASDSALSRVLPVGSSLVAIGTSGVQHCAPPQGEGQVCDPLPIALWTSADGRAWQRAPTPTDLAGVSLADVAAAPSGLVLVGDTGWDRPGIWVSADGVAWHRESLPPDVFAKAHFAGIVAAHGGWVLTGFTGGSKPVCCAGFSPKDTTPAAWFTSDGTSWHAASVDGAKEARGDWMGRVFVGRDGLVAWGSPDASNGWTSPNGRHWGARPKPVGYPVIPQASDGQRIVGESYVDRDRLAFWVSTDGAAWQPLPATGAADQMPAWSGSGGSWADAEFLFPGALGLIGQNGTERFPLWLADAVTDP
jgi:hypothetical protein